MESNKIKELVDRLWKDPDTANWEAFARNVKKSSIRYYKTFFTKGKIGSSDNLRDAYVELYDKNSSPIFKVPIYHKENGKLKGATIYLKGLQNANR